MLRDANRTQVQEPRDDSSGYTSSPPAQQAYNTGQDGQGEGYQQYDQPYAQVPQQQPYGIAPCDVGPYELTSLGIRARTAGWLSYLFLWVTGLIFLLLEKENRFVRFHAMQSILFFGALSIIEVIIRFFETYSLFHIFGFGVISSVVGLAAFIYWIVLMVRASKGIYYKLPVIGDYADKLVGQKHL